MRVALAQPPAAAVPSKPAPPPPPASKPFRGYYRRSNDSTLFQPCGDPRSYDVVGLWEPLFQLREQYRYKAVYLGRPLFAAVQGFFVDDTVRVTAAGATSPAPPTLVRRFSVSKLDTLRVRTESDCRGARSSSAK